MYDKLFFFLVCAVRVCVVWVFVICALTLPHWCYSNK